MRSLKIPIFSSIISMLMENSKIIIKIYSCKKPEKGALQEALSPGKISENARSNQPLSLIILITSKVIITVMH